MGIDISFHTNWGNLSVRAAGIVLRNNRVLLAKGEKTPYYLVGGTTQLNENSQETVRREFYEELGIVIEVERLIFVQERLFTVDNEKHHEIAFYYKLKNSEDFDRIEDGCYTDLGRKEILHWLPLNRLYETDIVPAFMKKKLAIPLPEFEHIIIDETL